MKKYRLLFVVIVVCQTVNILLAQDNRKVAQATLIYPIGVNGVKAPDYSNKFSLNILAGVNGGVNGFELGSIANIDKGSVNGLQIAGVTNITKNSAGVQLAGLVNYNSGKTRGFHLAAISNVNGDSSKGVGLGIVNVSKSSHSGLQVGIINYSKKMKGLQFGLFNIVSDTNKFISAGLFNMVKHGYYELEVATGDVIYFNINYKMGVKKFYTIYKLGTAFSYKGKSIHTFGLGVGTLVSINKKSALSLDASANQLVYDGRFTSDKVNILTKLDLNYRYSIGSKLSLLVGPSINFYVSEQMVDGKYGVVNVPYEISTVEREGRRTMIWIGRNAGFSYRL
jgi:hypothetical protein